MLATVEARAGRRAKIETQKTAEVGIRAGVQLLLVEALISIFLPMEKRLQQKLCSIGDPAI